MSARGRRAPSRGFGRDAAGTVSVEFAMLLPVLVTLFFGCYEASNLVLANLKLDDATQTAADLAAQTQIGNVLQPSDVTNFAQAADAVMAPLPAGSLQLAFASITYSTGSPVIDWHHEVNGAAPITLASIPSGLGTNSTQDSLIVVSAQYSYTSPLSLILASTYTLSNTAYDRPRYVACIPDFTNTNGSCP